MNKLIRTFGEQSRMAVALCMLYTTHLVVFHVLLSNPYDYLTTTSFADYTHQPDLSSDCLMMLAKQDTAKEVRSGTDYPAFQAHVKVPDFILQPLVNTAAFSELYHLYCNGCKLYRLLGVFLL